ncbi:hypothetical protein ACFLU1_02760 [Chloroflexota bacterium]
MTLSNICTRFIWLVTSDKVAARQVSSDTGTGKDQPSRINTAGPCLEALELKQKERGTAFGSAPVPGLVLLG